MPRQQRNGPSPVRYPRDPSLDPQLVWTGKDEQDAHPLEVQAVRLHVHERIEPQVLIADLCASAGKNKPPTEAYCHDRHWANRLILGDSLLVMTSLAERERLKGRVQMVYFDPPYGIKFGSNWQVSTRRRDVKDRAEDLTRQPEQIRAYRDTWELGIHSYLTYLRDRLTVARELITDSGSLFVQIGDENAHLARCLLDEVFGRGNFIATIAFKKKKMPLGETFLFTTCDYLLWYGKDRQSTRFRKLFVPRDPGAEGDYSYVELPDGTCRPRAAFPDGLPAGARLFQSMDLRSSGRTESCVFPFEFEGRTFIPSEGRSWKTTRAGLKKLQLAGRLFAPGEALRYRLYFDDYPVQELSHVWTDTQGATDKGYVVQTSTKVIERCLLMTTDPGDLVLDPTCGGGTTAHVAEQWGRRWVTIDTSRVALALTRTRLMTARFPSYRLADPSGRDLRLGFVYQRVPHVTLRSIANNSDIRADMTRRQIHDAVCKHADAEVLYDRPEENRNMVRVAGPFTVEGLSPQHALPDFSNPAPHSGSGSDFVHTILENLRKAGVQNTIAGQRLTFDRLDLHPGTFVQAEGEYSENGCRRRVRVSIGPQFGVVDADWVQQASRESLQDPHCAVLVVCGFAFDPRLPEAGLNRRKSIRVLPVRMSPDLTMGNDLLKKTGTGNLFLAFGEPDLVIEEQPAGRLIVEVRGLDVYDPTTASVRSHGTEEIACWFLDTDHDGQTFFVRHAYFCGGDPYARLQRALRAEIDEAEWAKRYATRSTPFSAPRSGRIAIKLINHYGDEVLKVYPVPARPSPRKGK